MYIYLHTHTYNTIMQWQLRPKLNLNYYLTINPLSFKSLLCVFIKNETIKNIYKKIPFTNNCLLQIEFEPNDF